MGRHHSAGGPAVQARNVNGGPVPDPSTILRAADGYTNHTQPTTASDTPDWSFNRIDFLRSFPQFSSAPDAFFREIDSQLTPVHFQQHQTIITEGEEAKAMYLLVRGTVCVTSRDGESSFAELSARTFFGEIGILMDMPRTASIVAKCSSTAIRLNKDDLKRVLKKFPQVNKAILKEADQRLAALEIQKKAQTDSKHPFGDLTRSTKRPRDPTDDGADFVVGNKKSRVSSRVDSETRAVPRQTKQALSTHFDGSAEQTEKALGERAGDAVDQASPEPAESGTNGIPAITLVSTSGEDEGHGSSAKTRSECDPDPFLNVDLDHARSRSRRASLAPPPPGALPVQEPAQETSKKQDAPSLHHESAKPNDLLSFPVFQPDDGSTSDRPSSSMRQKIDREPCPDSKCIFPDDVMVQIFKHLDLPELMRLRVLSLHCMRILYNSSVLLQHLDLTPWNLRVTDRVVVDIICPFVGQRPKHIDISNCFHLTDEGFLELVTSCGANVKTWKMKSVWDVTGQAVVDMTNKAKALEEIDLSNCRKVGDNLLARVIGWVVPDWPPGYMMAQPTRNNGRHYRKRPQQTPQKPAKVNNLPKPGTVIGCPQLKRLALSYCKHITNRSMDHIAAYASLRLEEINLTRCTTINDDGFKKWTIYEWPKLQKMCLADCTYLTDQGIEHLTAAAKELRDLDLSFCCALSDRAIDAVARGCSNLTHLNLAFCGSAVSDESLRTISLHLSKLKYLCVRGCVRVTGTGVEAVLEGCTHLEQFDVSQCKNLGKWLEGGGIRRKGRNVNFCIVADGSWRAPRSPVA